ncbi:multidrug SMR transporter [Shewanella sp. NFH-SH190041]|uniref:DMT family transporter n=1 Tax=Shewanella sp. NFH-SH190041 TaxID=2950245 RepID=UPI0021C3D19F|nr:SMR family transporter [Shewanella sp. NFH-SH190041]BDM63756.1 multidrug SMR transporter [Shewanella sp. NFH-SH190041]
MGYWYLAIAIATEVMAILPLKVSHVVSHSMPSTVSIIDYCIAFYFLSLGAAYIIWAGIGILLVTVISAILYRQLPDLAAIIGTVLILASVMMINVYAKTVRY